MKNLIKFYRRYSNWVNAVVPLGLVWLSLQLGISQFWGWGLFAILSYMFIAMIIGAIYTRIRYGFKLPNEDNYNLKGDYILPFNGEWTVVAGGIDEKHAHGSGKILPPLRYAYDFSIIYENEEEAKLARESTVDFPTNLDEYPAYGKDVIAVADGEVVVAVRHHPESRVGGFKTYNDTTDERGNFVVIKHHKGEYSLTAHLQYGSILVKKGDMVKQGQVIAKCGNSGNTNAPHLHFQLQSGKYAWFSAGLPIAFSNIKAKQSDYYKDLFVDTGKPMPTVENNLKVIEKKSYIGRGLDVENGADESHVGGV